MTLPLPSAKEQALSQRLAARIADSVRAAGGWLSFDAWMNQALYTPGLGYYSGPLRQFGREGDFVTAPELSSLFAPVIARQLAQWFGHVPAHVVECGAGSGQLAAGLLRAFQDQGIAWERYSILEVSAALRAQQQATLAQHVPAAMARVQWLDALPPVIEGVVLGNELLDAMPVRVWEHRAGAWLEWGVTLADGGGFDWAARPADAGLCAGVQADWPDGQVLSDAYRSEWAPQVHAWVRTVAERMQQAVVLLFDYGFPTHEYYHPQRATGTLVAHYRHRMHHDVLAWPGLQDITAHVNFSAVARVAQHSGLDVLGFVSQARFLLNAGVLTELAQHMPQGVHTVAQARMVGALQTLLSEAEMGEIVKVLALGRGVPDEALGFTQGDRRAVLLGPSP